MGNIQTLNDQLHDQLARLNSDIKGEDLKVEIDRAKSMAAIGSVIVNNNKVALDAIKLIGAGKTYREDLRPLLGEGKK